MPVRRRKKPPNPSTFSILSFTYLHHVHTLDLAYPSPRCIYPSFDLNKIVGLVSYSTQSLSQASATVAVFCVLCLRLWPRVDILHVGSCRGLIVHCSLAWLVSGGLFFSDLCIMTTVKAVILFKIEPFQRLISAGHGKYFSKGCTPTTTCEVWVLTSLYCWVYLPPFLAAMFL